MADRKAVAHSNLSYDHLWAVKLYAPNTACYAFSPPGKETPSILTGVRKRALHCRIACPHPKLWTFQLTMELNYEKFHEFRMIVHNQDSFLYMPSSIFGSDLFVAGKPDKFSTRHLRKSKTCFVCPNDMFSEENETFITTYRLTITRRKELDDGRHTHPSEQVTLDDCIRKYLRLKCLFPWDAARKGVAESSMETKSSFCITFF
jgi:hypothetical protein